MNNMVTTCRQLVLPLLLLAVSLCVLGQAPRAGYTARATSITFEFNDNPVYAYTGQTRTVEATVSLSFMEDGEFDEEVHDTPSWDVTISGPGGDTTVACTPSKLTHGKVQVPLPAAAGIHKYTATVAGTTDTATVDAKHQRPHR